MSAADEQGAPERREVDLPVRAVVLLEDRAHVTRRGTVSLAEGPCRLRVADVSPVISDKTLTARAVRAGDAAAAADVHDVRVRRLRRIAREDHLEAVRLLDEEIAGLEAQHARATAQRAVVLQELQGVGRIDELALDEIADDVAWDRAAPETWDAALDALAEAERAVSRRVTDLDLELAELAAALERKRHRRSALEPTTARNGASLEIDLGPAGAGEHEVEVSYVVPAACWRPRHTAELLLGAGGEAEVRWQSAGCAWQATGEDWTDVELCFSTERLSLGAEPPLLADDVLAVTRKSPALVVQEREQRIEQTGLGRGAERAEGLPGIDDGGEPQRLVAAHPVTVPSDGRPHLVPLHESVAPAQVELASFPELAAAVILKSTQTNTGKQPILAGPVDLVRGGGLAGRTSVLYVAPGERFALGWGPEGSLRVQREVEHLKEESNLIGSWMTRAQEVKVHLSNLGPAERSLRVTERVPVSEIEKVQITVVGKETTDAQRADERGFVQWQVTLPPFGHTTVRLRYLLKKHADVVGI
jgi:uncharacterized protein (TIGR02231 family)